MVKYRCIIILFLLLGLGCRDSKQLNRIEQMALEEKCREVGHGWKYQGYDHFFGGMNTCLPGIVVETGEWVSVEVEGPWTFKCERCGGLDLKRADELSWSMRNTIRNETGCWPGKALKGE